jgi:hypothetical protein
MVPSLVDVRGLRRAFDVSLTTLDERCARNERIFGAMKALVLDAVGTGFDLIGREARKPPEILGRQRKAHRKER